MIPAIRAIEITSPFLLEFERIRSMDWGLEKWMVATALAILSVGVLSWISTMWAAPEGRTWVRWPVAFGGDVVVFGDEEVEYPRMRVDVSGVVGRR